jgi:hypothetical protein
MLSTPTQRDPLTGWQVFGLYFAMVTVLSALTLATPTVTAHSTSPSAVLVWTGPWATVVLVLALLAWWMARRTGIGLRDGYRIAPRWACSHRQLVRTEHSLDAAITAGVALSIFLTAYSFTWVMGPAHTTGGWLPLVLFTQATTAVISELVLLGVLAAAATALKWGGQTFVLASMASRIVIAAPHWSALVGAGVSGVALAALYLHTRRLTPIILAHTTAISGLTLTSTWITSLA